MIGKATALGLLVAAGSASAFAPGLSGGLTHAMSPGLRAASAQPANVALAMSSAGDAAAQRRDFLRVALCGGAALAFGGGANAEVAFDTERYGDKELKVALINQVKQQFRALYEKKPELIIPLFKLAMADALTYDPKTGKGGLDGSVLRSPDPSLEYLKPAIDEVEKVRKDLVSKTEISCSDILAFAGSVALEATGAPRVKTQLGRMDGKKPQPASGMTAWDPKSPTAKGIKEAVMGSGLTAKDAVLLAGTVGQLRNAGVAMAQTLAEKKECNPDEDDDCQSAEEGYYGIYAPVTILSETNKQFGKNRGASAVNSNVGFDSARIAGLAGGAKFGNSFLVAVAKGEDKSELGKALMSDDELKKWVLEYGKPGNGNSNKFSKDAVSTYLKMVELGRSNAR
uniref:Plant heme peroxidase family profile domain-containing protein n=1 Tax=Hemiselmis tepida TaxID=464990 RepID=A0A7S0W1W4_9CRYP|mmetsp:Transcript_35530/g.90797  ORF Transcript_35530/g.90797 Transcript_35530/m.90797 type:complete len:398 (+) Transcript_35530:64-1257(+)